MSLKLEQRSQQQRWAWARLRTSRKLLLPMCLETTSWEGSMMFRPSASHFLRRASSPFIDS